MSITFLKSLSTSLPLFANRVILSRLLETVKRAHLASLQHLPTTPLSVASNENPSSKTYSSISTSPIEINYSKTTDTNRLSTPKINKVNGEHLKKTAYALLEKGQELLDTAYYEAALICFKKALLSATKTNDLQLKRDCQHFVSIAQLCKDHPFPQF